MCFNKSLIEEHLLPHDIDRILEKIKITLEKYEWTCQISSEYMTEEENYKLLTSMHEKSDTSKVYYSKYKKCLFLSDGDSSDFETGSYFVKIEIDHTMLNKKHMHKKHTHKKTYA